MKTSKLRHGNMADFFGFAVCGPEDGVVGRAAYDAVHPEFEASTMIYRVRKTG